MFGYNTAKQLLPLTLSLGACSVSFVVFVVLFFALEKYYRLVFVFRQLKSLPTNMFSGVLDRAPICAQISSRCSLGMKAHAYCMFPGILVFQFPQSGQGDGRVWFGLT